MNATPTRLLVVDDDHSLAEMLRRILVREGYEVEVAHSAEEALNKSQAGDLALAVVDVMLPGMDGYSLCREFRQRPISQGLPILMLTAKGDIADKIAGFEAGADDYLTKPFQPKELTYRIGSLLARAKAVPPTKVAKSEQGSVFALFSSKGGVGKTTIASNLAVALKRLSDKPVALVDADFFFGDVGVHLNLPKVRTMLELLERGEPLTPELTEQVMIPHSSGIRVMLSPFGPEASQQIRAADIEAILNALAQQYEFVLVDCQPSYDERMLRILQRADEVLMVVTPEIGPLKNTSIFLEWAGKRGYSLEKISVVLNRFNSNVGIGPEEIERTLHHEVTFRLISGGRPVVMSVNRGVPLVIEQPDHPFCLQINRMAEYYIQRIREGSGPGVQVKRGPSA